LPLFTVIFAIMPVDISFYQQIRSELEPQNITLVAVSKTKPVADIETLYQAGQIDFGENYVQEFLTKQAQLPVNIRWHFIGHLQTNKVKMILPYVYLIHGVDSIKLLKEINKQAGKIDKVVNCLLQVHIAEEETKFGLDEAELAEVAAIQHEFTNVSIKGVMGMATFTQNEQQIRAEFQHLFRISQQYSFNSNPIISMGMSSDYRIAVEEGSTMVRIGSRLFGSRN